MLKRYTSPIAADHASSFEIAPDGSWLATQVVTDDDAHVAWLSLSTLEERRYDPPTSAATLPHISWKPRSLAQITDAASLPNAAPKWSADELAPVVPMRVLPSADSKQLVIAWASSGVMTYGPLTGVSSLIDAGAATARMTVSGGAPTLSPSGRWLVVGMGSGAWAIYDVPGQRGRLFYDPLCTQTYMSFRASFSPSEERVALPGPNSRACVVNTKTARLKTLAPASLPHHRGAHGGGGVVVPGEWYARDAFLVTAPEWGPIGTLVLGSTEWVSLRANPAPSAFSGHPASDPIVVRRARDRSLFVVGDQAEPGYELVGSRLELRPPAPDLPYASHANISADGELYIRSGDPRVRSTRNKQVVSMLQQATGTSPALSPRGRFAFTQTGPFRVWETSGGLPVFDVKLCADAHRGVGDAPALR